MNSSNYWSEPVARFNVEFSAETLKVLDDLRKRQGCTKAEVLRKCVAFEKWWLDTVQSGGRFIIRYPDGTEREIVKL